ncbi:hydroxymethylglutaryl-CoA lyase [Citricoccus sp. K5]|uniref:hydroxymethylglutaryl-CoA lyase n=1 Tax=Citricoccus sp. K5 TaxID=2653135 RepID=UPI0012F1B2CF|nr:hydroxymethylglutaryl-CoA lyase [Citricoccus sp. K5]VXC03506.1 (R)-citramalyl-CoA lyase [Citricoccus sp. K5]
MTPAVPGADIQVTEVFLRDGLQDEPVTLTPAQRVQIGEAIAAAGVRRMEVASFVHPRRVPQMAGAEEVVRSLQVSTTAEFTVLALNGRGVERAVAAGAGHIQIVTSASQAHSSANAGRTVEEALQDLGDQVAAHPGVDFFAGISTAFTCPYEGRIDPERLLWMVRSFQAMGVTDIGLADTLGTTPTEELVASLDHVLAGEPDLTYYLHLHNAHGQALTSVDAAIERGITRFDAALGGYGGCPFAPGAAGNLSTGDLVRHLHEQGHRTGIDEDLIAEATSLARNLVSTAPRLPEASNA